MNLSYLFNLLMALAFIELKRLMKILKTATFLSTVCAFHKSQNAGKLNKMLDLY